MDYKLPKLYPIQTIDPATINIPYPDNDFRPRPSLLNLIGEYEFGNIISGVGDQMDQQIICMLYQDGYSQCQVAEHLECCQATVSLRHSKMIGLLKTKYEV